MVETNVIKHLTRDELFGSQTNLARAAGCTPQTICEKRNSENPLTHRQMRRILSVGPEMGVPVTPEDFFPELAGRRQPPRRKKAA